MEERIKINLKFNDKKLKINSPNVVIPVGGVTPSGTLEISQNGVHNVKYYEFANVNVPIPEGYLKPEGMLSIVENGEYSVIPFESVLVDVPIPEGYIVPEGTLEVSIEGTYDVTPYASVTFDVETEEVAATPTEETQTFIPGENKFIDKVVVNPIPSEYLIPEGSIDIVDTQEYDVTEFKMAKIVDENLKAENIAENVEVLGITGTFRGGVDTSDGDVTADDILLGKVAYAKEERIVGTIETYDYSNSEDASPEIDKFITGELTEIYNDRVTTLSAYAMRPISASVLKLSFPNVVKCNTSIYGCAKATEVYLPKVTSISNQEFQGCTKLYIVEIPNVTRLEPNTFSSCKELEKLEFNNLTYIANSAFSGCTAFKTLILRGDSVCQLAGTAPYFKDTLIASGSGYVYVKDELVEEYKVATNWSTIASQIKPLSELEVE